MLSRRGFLRCSALALAGAAVGRPSAGSTPGPGRPNLLVIVADDMGFSDAGCYGGEVHTPTLDGLAARGLRFTQMYSTGRCWPSRACILTGYYAQQVRMDPPRGRLPAWTRVAPHYLKPLGYRCYHSGKWHLFGAPKPVRDGGFHHSYHLKDQNRFFSTTKHFEDDRPLPPTSPDSGWYATTAIADHAIRCLKQHAEKHPREPFFEYLAFTAPHFPLHAPPEDIARYDGRYTAGWDAVRRARHRRMREMGLVACALAPLEAEVKPPWNLTPDQLRERIGPGEVPRAVPWDGLAETQKAFQARKMAIHAAMIDRMDREIGRVLDQVRAMGQYENTAVLFVSDNGASAEQMIRGDGHDPSAPPGSWRTHLCLGPGWSTASNTPLRLHKSWVHEGGIASPLIVHWPAGLRARGELRHTPAHFIDLLPTLLALAGGEASARWNGRPVPPLPGRSLVPALARDAVVPRDFLFFHHRKNRAIRVGDWKLVAAGPKGPWELYNLRDDRCECRDLAEAHPEKVRRLAEAWAGHEQVFRRLAGSEEPPA